MITRFELGRIAGVPIYLDMILVLILILFSHRYFTSGDAQLMSAGILIIIGILFSILLHELGHMLAARIWRVRTDEIEIGGLGGIARFSSSLPRSVMAQTVIYLAGPAANLLLWKGFGALTIEAWDQGKPMLGIALASLSGINFWLMIFNLLPAFPLDGGRTLEAWLTAALGYVWAIRIVAALGLVVTALVVWMALPLNIWLLFVAFALFQANWGALDTVGGFRGRR
ncbi:MAG: site-2 protease family protein [Hyphomicrobiaceae bacterium]